MVQLAWFSVTTSHIAEAARQDAGLVPEQSAVELFRRQLARESRPVIKATIACEELKAQVCQTLRVAISLGGPYLRVKEHRSAGLISGLCHEGQLQIGVQEARKRRPDFSDDAWRALAKTVHELG